MKKRLAMLLISVLVIHIVSDLQPQAEQTMQQTWIPTLILDAGHGGEDGGAVSITGVAESGLNLAITQRLDAILGLFGEEVILLREEDVSLHDGDAVTLREKKASDLKNRAAAVADVTGGVLLSIHQNSYPEEKYWGTQTFYADTPGSKELAEHIQCAIKQTIQAENLRRAKAIDKNVYLMNHVECPAVLVECGFLSNRTEEALLRQEEYQKKLATVLAGAWRTAVF